MFPLRRPTYTPHKTVSAVIAHLGLNLTCTAQITPKWRLGGTVGPTYINTHSLTHTLLVVRRVRCWREKCQASLSPASAWPQLRSMQVSEIWLWVGYLSHPYTRNRTAVCVTWVLLCKINLSHIFITQVSTWQQFHIEIFCRPWNKKVLLYSRKSGVVFNCFWYLITL